MAQALYRMRKPVTTTGGPATVTTRTPRGDQPHPHGHYGSSVHKSEARPPNEPLSSHDLGEALVVRSTKRNLLDQLRVYGYRLGKRIGEGSYSKVYYAKYVGDQRPDTPQYPHPASQNHASRQPKSTAPVPPRSAPHPYRAVSASTTPASTTKTTTTTTNASSNKTIACKVIDARCTSAEYMDKFLPRELEIIKHLNHPHIVSVYTILEVGPFICCFMDFCAFGDLLDRIRFRGPLTAAETQLYFGQLASAVFYLHSESIAHRDIKCENVLLHSRHCVKLTDFGFSRPLLTCRQTGAVAYSETFCGSAAYAAPEVLKGIAYDPRRYDMWSLGCVLFIMATGSMPYDDENIATTIRRQEQHHIAYPADADVGAELRDLIGRLLDPDVEGRLSVQQLMEEPWVIERPPSAATGNVCTVDDKSFVNLCGCDQ